MSVKIVFASSGVKRSNVSQPLLCFSVKHSTPVAVLGWCNGDLVRREQ